MLAWITRARRRRKRELFRFHDGRQWRSIDPMRVFRAVHHDEEYNPEVHPKLVDAGDSEAVEVTLRMIQRVFGVKPYDEASGSGMLELEQLQMFVDFHDYLYEVKKNINPSRISQTNMESMSPELSEPTTSDTSHSTSSGTDPPSEKPT